MFDYLLWNHDRSLLPDSHQCYPRRESSAYLWCFLPSSPTGGQYSRFHLLDLPPVYRLEVSQSLSSPFHAPCEDWTISKNQALSSKLALFHHCIRYLNLAIDDFLSCRLSLLNGVLRDKVAVVFVHRIGHPIFVESVNMEARLKFPINYILHNRIDGVIHPLHHARQHKAGLHHVLIGIDANYKVSGAPVLFSLLLNSVKSAEAGISRRRKDNVRTLAYLGQRYFFSLTRIVPGGIGHAYVVLDHANVRVDRTRAFFVTHLKPVDQPNIHTAKKPYRPRVGRLGGQYADQI